MKKINIVFDDEFDDVDILLVPDDIADNIENVVQEFFNWVEIPENRKRFVVRIIDGYEIISFATEEFIWWLNEIKIQTPPKAEILIQHTKYIPDYPSAEF